MASLKGRAMATLALSLMGQSGFPYSEKAEQSAYALGDILSSPLPNYIDTSKLGVGPQRKCMRFRSKPNARKN